MEDENMQDMSFPDGFEDVTSEYTGRTQAADDAGGTSAHAKTAGKKGVRGIFTPDMLRKYAPAAGYFLFWRRFSASDLHLKPTPSASRFSARQRDRLLSRRARRTGSRHPCS